MWWFIASAAAEPQTLNVPCAVTRPGVTSYKVGVSDNGTSITAVATLTVADGQAKGALTNIWARVSGNGQSSKRPGPYTWTWTLPQGPGQAIAAKASSRGALRVDLDKGMGSGAYVLAPFAAHLGDNALPFGLEQIMTAAEIGCGAIPKTSTTTPIQLPNPWGGEPLPGTSSIWAERQNGEIHVTRILRVDDEAWSAASPPSPRHDDPNTRRRGDVSWTEGYRDTIISRFVPKTGALLGLSASREVHGGRLSEEWRVGVSIIEP